MKSIFRGELATRAGRRNAWLDALFIDHAALRLFWTNFRAVEPGILYLSNHPTPGNLRRFARQAGINTLISLRGATGNGTDALARETARQLGLDIIDLPMRSRVAPTRAQVLALLETFRTMRGPALVHCKSGADRAGFAGAVFLLGQGRPAAEARRQLSLRHGHMAGSPAGILDAFVAAWGREEGGGKSFAQWVAQDYDDAALARGFKARRLSRLFNDRILSRE
ncbi:fused DSP-PTPase phosphatase/NAD kinase-like protein [Acidocella sp.]|uniref:phosphatase domain-containing protein n=1 Tax=Acidocella sp. TaxID=50710 RepID=UPI00261D52B6|nr:sulfur transferase domain-containing protein [Acidocella sp.]